MLITLIAGCAHLDLPQDDVYPFRALFDATGVIDGKEIIINGALLITTRTTGIAQIYGPGGIALYSAEIIDGTLVISDTFSRVIHSYSVPVEDIVGVFAGDVPRGVYLTRKQGDSHDIITYPWGTLYIDEKLRPRQVHVKTKPSLDCYLTPGWRDPELLIIRGSDTVLLSLSILEGGRWAE
ncbi:MAG: hypothetical protein ACP5G0_07710 [Desulfomonilia bacterium]